jgi:hypothetical protein
MNDLRSLSHVIYDNQLHCRESTFEDDYASFMRYYGKKEGWLCTQTQHDRFSIENQTAWNLPT